jgi:hypothetical protein
VPQRLGRPAQRRHRLTKVPKSAQPHVATQVRTIFDQPDAEAVHAQFDRVVAALAERFPDAAEHLDAARADLLAFTAYPREIWRQIWSNNPQERLNKRDPPPHRRGRDLPRPRRPDPPGRRRARRIKRRVDRRPPLHEPRGPGQKPHPRRHHRTRRAHRRSGRDRRANDRINSTKITRSRSHTPAPRTWPLLASASPVDKLPPGRFGWRGHAVALWRSPSWWRRPRRAQFRRACRDDKKCQIQRCLVIGVTG